mgnify:CR=1 FL=1
MCDEKELVTPEEPKVLFTDDVELLEDRLSDIILAMGLPAEQTDAVLRLINDILEDHHAGILNTFEEIISDVEEDLE